MNRSRLLLPIIIIVPLFSLSGQAQVYRGNLYGGDGRTIGSSCIFLDDGGIAVVGTAGNEGFGVDDILLIRLDPYLQLQWSRIYGGMASDRGMSVIQNGNKGFLLMGASESYSAGKEDILVISVDPEGNLLWARSYGGAQDDIGYSMRAVSGGGFLIAGTTRSFGSRSWAAFLLRIDDNGDILWFRLYDNLNTDAAADFEQTADGGFIVTGWTYAIGAGMHDVLLFKTHADGSLRWARLFGGPNDDGGYKVHEIPGGGYVVMGNTHSFGHGAVDAFVFRIAEGGRPQWMYAIGREGEDSFRQSYRDSDSTITLAGWLTRADDNRKETWIARISITGNLLYSGTVRGSFPGQAHNLVAGRPGYVLLTGEYMTPSNPSLFVSEARIPLSRNLNLDDVVPAPAFDASIAMSAKSGECHSRTVPIKSMLFSPRISADPGRLESTAPQEKADLRSRLESVIAPGDSARFILSRIAEIADARKVLGGQIPCDFSIVDKQLERTEAILRIGDYEHSLENLWKAESLFRVASCGPVSIEELTALGSHYDGRGVELTGSVVRKRPSAGGDGYFMTLTDNTGEIDAFYEGTLRDIAEGDRVRIGGSYSHDKATIFVRSITKVGSPGATGLLAAGLAVIIALAVVVYRWIKRRTLRKTTLRST